MKSKVAAARRAAPQQGGSSQTSPAGTGAIVPGMARRLISSGSSFEREIGYSRAVVCGDCVFVAGTTGFDYSTMTISEDFPATWPALRAAFGDIRPAATMIEAGLADPRMKIEIEVDAVISAR